MRTARTKDEFATTSPAILRTGYDGSEPGSGWPATLRARRPGDGRGRRRQRGGGPSRKVAELIGCNHRGNAAIAAYGDINGGLPWLPLRAGGNDLGGRLDRSGPGLRTTEEDLRSYTEASAPDSHAIPAHFRSLARRNASDDRDRA